MKEINRWLLLNAAATLALMLIVVVIVILGWKSNNDRINDIQASRVESFARIQSSRVESCQQTYEGVRQVFQPLVPPPALQTPKQRKDIRTFNRQIGRLKRGCERQVATPKPKVKP